MFKFGRLAAICLALASSPAIAQTDSHQLPANFLAIIHAPQQESAVLSVAPHSTTWLRHGCQTGSFRRFAKLIVWDEVKFDSSGLPISGSWSEGVEATGCGITRILNVLNTFTGVNVLNTSLLAPGETRVNAKAQLDASRYAYFQAHLKVKDCKQAYLDDTKFDGHKPNDDHDSRPVLLETWTINACGESIPVEMQFISDATGMTIVTHTQ